MPSTESHSQSQEICVISDLLLEKLKKAQAPATVTEYETDSGYTDDDVFHLRIDFQSILKIDNLISFRNLTKLQLDNNLIEHIENLEHMTQLQWLDLSYNNIEHVGGLDALTNLTDLSLHHNQIQVIEGLDKLEKLDVLSIGDNLLETVKDSVLYMRQFQKLRSLNMKGNPMCDDPDYEARVIAFLPSLRYVDWFRLSDETKVEAELKFQDELSVLQIKEDEKEKLLKEAAIKKVKEDLYKDAAVPEMYGGHVFARILDPTMKKMFPIPGVEDACDDFRDTFNENVALIGAAGLTFSAVRKEEKEMFFEALDDGVEENREKGRILVDAFVQLKAEVQADIDMLELEQGVLATTKLENLKDTLSELRYNLMENEQGLVGSIEESKSLFDRSFAELAAKATGDLQEKMSQIREAEEMCFKQSCDIAVAFLEKQIKGEVTEGVEVTDELMELLRDKASLVSSITGAHDNHALAIEDKEDEITQLVKGEYTGLITMLSTTEARRNRSRVAEIVNFVSVNSEELDKQLDEHYDAA